MGGPPPRQRLVTQQQYDKTLAEFDAQGGIPDSQRADLRQQIVDQMVVPPAPAPDLSDELIKQRAMQIRRKLLMGGMTGPLDLSPGAVMAPKLGGY